MCLVCVCVCVCPCAHQVLKHTGQNFSTLHILQRSLFLELQVCIIGMNYAFLQTCQVSSSCEGSWFNHSWLICSHRTVLLWSHYVSMVQTEARSGPIPWRDYPHLFLAILLSVGGDWWPQRTSCPGTSAQPLFSQRTFSSKYVYQGVLMSWSFQSNPRVFIHRSFLS